LLNLRVIALFVILAARDMMDEPLAGDLLSPGGVALGVLALYLFIGSAMSLLVRRAARTLDRTGSTAAVHSAESALLGGQWAVVAAHAAGVLVFGWLDAVRSLTGDVVLVDELLAAAPAIGVFLWGWSSVYTIDRALREATIYRTLHAGTLSDAADDSVAGAYQEVFYPIPTRGAFVLAQLRHQVLLSVTPLLLLSGWVEGGDVVMSRLVRVIAHAFDHAQEAGAPPSGLLSVVHRDDVQLLVGGLIKLAGIVGVFIISPAVLRVVWDTVRLPDGQVRRSLQQLCDQQRIRIRDILIWRTHGSLLNGAVMGLVPRFRYVMLTDVLLDTLPAHQLRAVMAHELAHVRHRHIIWLGLCLIACIGAASLVSVIIYVAIFGDTVEAGAVSEMLLSCVAVGAGVLGFGYVSRRFEWQSDAFAAKCLSMSAQPGVTTVFSPDGAVTPAGADAMADALGAVARLNHTPVDLASWRHGSIAVRQSRLKSLIGLPFTRLPIDRTARRLKLAVLVIMVIQLGLVAMDYAYPEARGEAAGDRPAPSMSDDTHAARR